MKYEKRTPELRLKLEGWRSTFVLMVALAGFLVLLGRAFYLQGMDHGFLQAKGEARYGRVIEMPASRGPVVDRNGQPLAISTPVESIWTDPEDLELDARRIQALARTLQVSPAELRQKIANKDRQFVYLKRQIPPDQAAKVMALRISGVFEQREYRRYYPTGELMAHVVGFTGVDDNGQEGIELAEQARLAGTPGSRKVIKDRRGRVVEDLESVRAPRDGEPVQLAIDQRLQFLARRELKAAYESTRAKSASLVILDAHTGEVLALVNQPDYNPNNRADVTGAQIRNRCVTDTFEPGSIMKPFTIAAALDAGIVKPDSLIDTAPGRMKIGHWTISDDHPHGLLTVAQIIQVSSNIGTAKIMLRMSPQHMGTLFHELGFGVAPHTGFPGEAKGVLHEWNRWSPIEQATIAYGHGLSVSLMQMAHAYTVFTNEGRLLPISLLKRDDRPVGKPIYTPRSVHAVIRMLEMAVMPGGTAPLARVPGYRVAGKTGTAMKNENGHYEHRYQSSFVGFGPVSDPRFIVAVTINDPQGARYFGGDVSAPVFSRVMGQALRLVAIAPDAPETLDVEAVEREIQAKAPEHEGSAG